MYIAGNVVNISFEFDGHPWLVERVGATGYLAYHGSAVTPVESGATTISAPFDGYIEFCDPGVVMNDRYSCAPLPPGQRARCTSRTHRLLLTRR